MSKQTVAQNTGLQATINTDRSKVFLWNRRSIEAQYNNGTSYDPVTLLEGLVMGRVSADGLVKPWTAGASDGSQFPIGLLMRQYVVEEGETVPVFVVDDGDAAGELIEFANSNESLNSVVSGRQVRDWLKLAGIKVIEGAEMTGYDNQPAS